MSTKRMSRRSALDALHEGIDARQAKQPVTACPYPMNGTLTEQFLGMFWVKGWRRAGDLETAVPRT